jgi:transposase
VPVLLVAHEEKTGFLVRDAKSADVSDISAQKSYNKLKEVTAESAHFNTRQIYVLYKNEFVLNKEGDLAKGKVYMENPKYVAPSSPSSPAPANLSIAWGNVTGIEDGRWKMEDGRSDRWYTLDGRCLIGKPTAKGLYIVNGKKRVVK